MLSQSPAGDREVLSLEKLKGKILKQQATSTIVELSILSHFFLIFRFFV